MIEIVKKAARSRWTPVLVAGIVGLALAGEAQAATVASIQRNYDQSTGQVRPYDPAATQTQYAPVEVTPGVCTHTALERRYNNC